MIDDTDIESDNEMKECWRTEIAYWRWYVELLQRVLAHPAMADESKCSLRYPLGMLNERALYEAGKTVDEVFADIEMVFSICGW